MFILLTLEPALGVTVLHAGLIDELITSAGVLNSVLPLKVQLMAFLMDAFEFFGGLIELNLGSLSLSHFLLELLGFTSHFNRKFLDLQRELLDFSLVSTAELLKREVVLFFLAGGESPLLQLLLVPVHLQFELVHALVRLKDHVLNVVETILLVGDSLLQLFNFIAKTS